MSRKDRRPEFLKSAIVIAVLFAIMVTNVSTANSEIDPSDATKRAQQSTNYTSQSPTNPAHPLGVPWVSVNPDPPSDDADSTYVEFNLKEKSYTDVSGRRSFFPNIREFHQQREAKLEKLSEIGKFSLEFDTSQLEELKSFQGTNLSDVVTIVKDPFFSSESGGAMIILGLLGDESHVPVLIEYIEREESAESISTMAFMAKGQALEALGLLANRTKSLHANDYLAKQLGGKIWTDRSDINLLNNDYSKQMMREFGLEGAIKGFALSGSPEAEQVLESLPEKIKLDAEFANYLDRSDEGAISSKFLGSAIATAKKARSVGAAAAFIDGENEKRRASEELHRINEEKARVWNAATPDTRTLEAPIIPVH